MLKLSIITVNLNNKPGLTRTLRSIVEQTYTNFEYIIIDGGSIDGSQQVIHDNVTAVNYWVSESDNGIYHAMNKGIQVAKGEYCLFLNSGDWLTEPNTLQHVFAGNPKTDIVSGDIYYYDNQANKIKWHIRSPEMVTAKTLFLGTLPHQATLIKRRLFDVIGMYNEQLKITSDWLFFVNALLVHKCTYHHFNGTISYFNMDGISCDPKTKDLPRREQMRFLQQEYPMFVPDYKQLNILETQAYQWIESREFRVYKFLERLGIIRFGVFCRRVKRVIQRNLFHEFTS